MTVTPQPSRTVPASRVSVLTWHASLLRTVYALRHRAASCSEAATYARSLGGATPVRSRHARA
eukprot:scaffold68563_cov69-Phaeocystis_antarctica.AAC.7